MRVSTGKESRWFQRSAAESVPPPLVQPTAPPRQPPAQLVEALDALRDVVLRNDCERQAKELALIVDASRALPPVPPEVRPLPELPAGAVEPLDIRGLLEQCEVCNDEIRTVQRRAAEEKLQTLQQEHAERMDVRKRIMEESLSKRLAEERIVL